ncbi:GH3 auxin-responsive promoter family protein [Sanyastnella coralliicola]|uniref:GH3 auxin-responsive promoter family protein n=1 Tax=Sanyastnella coralliicola TaxID=3069118 RepID=UPI0027B8A8B9|nr:GH3 auxin-responsive promoter family protein [Longitalea sp. SCSIO 12813]
MGIKSALSKPFARQVAAKVARESRRAVYWQEKQFEMLITQGRKTAFGKDHRFDQINTPEEFRQAVPVLDYEVLKTYVDRAVKGEDSVLWPGKPLYFCKTSGTTSGTKYIPLTKASMPNHIGSARNALLSYIAETGKAEFVNGKMIFLQGSPELQKLESGIPFGRLSGIVAHHVPGYLQRNRLPSMETNMIEEWETKLESVIDETIDQNMTLISGIPSWLQMYFERLVERSGKANIKEIFPNFSLMVWGGVNFEPYRARFLELIGEEIPSIETYPASEGFIAYQNSQEEEGLLLTFDSGIWYEFIPADKYFDNNPPRLSLAEVEIGVNYAVILNTNAGMWSYSIGDTVRFVSLDPPKIKVTGRIKHFTSAFGEHVIAEEVERALTYAVEKMPAQVREFHVAPEVNPSEGLPFHEWLIEFEEEPASLEQFAALLDENMCDQNVYYKDLITGSVLRTCKIRSVKRGSFEGMMRMRGKLGGQNKVPRLANDRSIADLVIQSSEQ